MIKFSIIVPVYNVENYLRECLNSVINQTYKNLEIICIDDGSTDNSGMILDEYESIDRRMIVVHKVNGGYGNAMNIGLERATGEYIGIIESDDYVELDMFEKFARCIDEVENILDVIKYSYTRFDREGKVYRKLFADNMCDKIISPTEYTDLFRTQCSIWSAVYNRKFLIKNHIRFLETPGASYQDMSFTFKVFCNANTILLSNESVYFYRINNFDSSINSSQKALCVCDEIKEIDSYISMCNLTTPFIINVKYVFMYQSYWWNYHRIYGGIRYVFWLKMIEELQAMIKDSKFDKKYFEIKDWNNIQELLADPEGYFKKHNPFFEEAPLDDYTMKESIYEDGLRNYFRFKSNYIIYGAGVYGKEVLDFMRRQGDDNKVIGFAVTDKMNQPNIVEGKPVYEIKELYDKTIEYTIIVAVKRESQLGILRDLRKAGFKKVIRVDWTFRKIINESK